MTAVQHARKKGPISGPSTGFGRGRCDFLRLRIGPGHHNIRLPMYALRRATRYAVAFVATLFATGATVEAQTDAEAAAWAAAARMGTRVGYEQFLQHFSESQYADVAIARLVELTLDEVQDDIRPAAPGLRGPRAAAAPSDIY